MTPTRPKRYEVRPQRPGPEYPYRGGYAVYDTYAGRQTGWFLSGTRAADAVALKNAAARPRPRPKRTEEPCD